MTKHKSESPASSSSYSLQPPAYGLRSTAYRLSSPLSRRQFLGAAAAGAVAGGAPGVLAASPQAAPGERFRGGRFEPPVAIATWKHGARAVEESYRILEAGGSTLDAVERGINIVEDDPAVTSVGRGGLPNEQGVVELDAAIMRGKGLRCGSVQSLRDIATPISVARRVMEKTRHVQLVGQGARRFALAQGFEEADLLTPASRRQWEAWKESPDRRVPGQVGGTAPPRRDAAEDHDTIGAVALDRSQSLTAGCSTSGLAWKMAGRVGDSPIIGAGLYCDDEVGGASATGIGEEVLRVCGSFLIVEAMRRGSSPQEAVEEALRRIVRADPRNRERQVAFIALSRRGEVGAGSIQPGFQLALRARGKTLLVETWSMAAPKKDEKGTTR